MAELKMDEFNSNIISVACPRNTPKTLISIRFRAVAIADKFIDRLRSNPPHQHGQAPRSHERWVREEVES
jgi:hypothetical protein